MAGLSLIWGSFDISINYSLRSIPTRLIPGLVQNGAQIIQLGLVWNGLGTRKK